MKTLLLFLAFIGSVELASAVSGTVWGKEGDVLILTTQSSRRPYIAVKNYSGPNGTVGKRITFDAPQTGTYDWAGTPIELYIYPTKNALTQPSSLTQAAPVAQEAAQLDAQIKQLDTQIANLQRLREEKQKRLETLRAAGVK